MDGLDESQLLIKHFPEVAKINGIEPEPTA